MRRVEPDGQQQRLHLGGKVFLDPAPLRRAALAVRDDFDAAFFEYGQQLLVEDHVLQIDQGMDFGCDLAKGLCGNGPALLVAHKSRQLWRKTHLEKLIQIG